MSKRMCFIAILSFFMMKTSISAESNISFSGFASTGLSVSDSDVPYRMDVTDSINFAGNSLFGLQINAELSDKASVAGQLVSRGDFDSDFKTRADWAYLRYEVNDKLIMRVGRFRFPLYLTSDYQDVRFSQPWVRSPDEVYGVVPPSLAASEGVDFLFQIPFGNYMAEIQPFIARSQFNTEINQIPMEGESKDTYGLNLNFSTLNSRVRIGHVHTSLDIDPIFLPDMMNGFNDLIAVGALPLGTSQIDEKYATIFRNGLFDIKEFEADFTSIGYELNYERLLLVAELAKTKTTAPLIPNGYGGYFTLGYRFGKFTPSLTLSQNQMDKGDQVIQKTTSFGLRYDATSNISMKVDLQSIKANTVTDDPMHSMIPSTPFYGFFDDDPEGRVNVLSMSVDVVF